MLAPLPPPTAPVIGQQANNHNLPWVQYFQSLDKFVRSGAGSDTVSISDFSGVDLTGGAASSAAFNAAIAQVGSAGGGTITIPGGSTIALDASLMLGNGTSSAVSTFQGVRIVGMGVPSTAGGGLGTPAATPVTFKWVGPTNTPMVQIAGPLVGWGIENILLDGQSVAGVTGLKVVAGQNGECRFLTVTGCKTGVELTAYGNFGAAIANSMHNTFSNLTILNPAVSGALALLLTGIGIGVGSGQPANSCYNMFFNTTIIAGNSGSETGLNLQGCDSNHFVGVHFYSGVTGTVAGATAVKLDYSVLLNWPESNYLDGVDTAFWATQFANSGTIGNFARANYVRLYEGNGAVAPALDNLIDSNDSAQQPPWVVGTGTGDALVANFAQTFDNAPDGKLFFVRAPGANAATTPAIRIQNRGSDIINCGITKKGGLALAANDIHGAGHELILRYHLSANQMELLNPAT
jgi:hypothetical protein